jgi:tetratricopeptide (TPR) repeat protein
VVGISVLVVIAYAQVIGHDFVNFDDQMYVLENPFLDWGLTLGGVIQDFASPYHQNWIPITAVSYRIDWALYGKDAAGYLITNVIIHLLASLILFFALCRMTHSLWRSVFVAGVFAIHPLHVESVAWVSERKDVLSGLMWMLTLYAYAIYVERAASRGRYLLVLGCFLIGLLAKPMLVTLPFVLLLLDYWPLGRLGSHARAIEWSQVRRAVIEKLPMFLMAAAVSAVAFAVQRSAGSVSSLSRVSVGRRLANALVSYVDYIADCFWPAGLAALYPYPSESQLSFAILAALFLVGITAVALFCYRSRAYLVVGWLWFLGTLVPVIGLVQIGTQARADRYMYLPLVGLAISITWFAGDWTDKRRGRRVVTAIASGAALIGLTVVSHQQVGYWRDTKSLFERAVAVTRNNWYAHVRLANVALNESDGEAALRHAAEALRIAPGLPEPHFALGDVSVARGDISGAYSHYEQGLSLQPENPLAQRGAGMLAARLGRQKAAVRHFSERVRLAPDDVQVANQLAWMLATSRDPEIRDPEEAIRLVKDIAADDPAIIDTLAAAYAAAGNFPKAVETARLAARLAVQRGEHALVEEIRSHQSHFEAGEALWE